ATPITSTNRDIRIAAACPSARSRTMARAMTMPAEAPIADVARATESQPRLGASAQPRLLKANSNVPRIIGRRRPKRSDRVPCVIWPTASPANQAASVSWAVPGSVPKDASTAGKAGRYMSVAAGPTAMKNPSRAGSQRGMAGVWTGVVVVLMRAIWLGQASGRSPASAPTGTFRCGGRLVRGNPARVKPRSPRDRPARPPLPLRAAHGQAGHHVAAQRVVDDDRRYRIHDGDRHHVV